MKKIFNVFFGIVVLSVCFNSLVFAQYIAGRAAAISSNAHSADMNGKYCDENPSMIPCNNSDKGVGGMEKDCCIERRSNSGKEYRSSNKMGKFGGSNSDREYKNSNKAKHMGGRSGGSSGNRDYNNSDRVIFIDGKFKEDNSDSGYESSNSVKHMGSKFGGNSSGREYKNSNKVKHMGGRPGGSSGNRDYNNSNRVIFIDGKLKEDNSDSEYESTNSVKHMNGNLGKHNSGREYKNTSKTEDPEKSFEVYSYKGHRNVGKDIKDFKYKKISCSQAPENTPVCNDYESENCCVSDKVNDSNGKSEKIHNWGAKNNYKNADKISIKKWQ